MSQMVTLKSKWVGTFSNDWIKLISQTFHKINALVRYKSWECM